MIIWIFVVWECFDKAAASRGFDVWILRVPFCKGPFRIVFSQTDDGMTSQRPFRGKWAGATFSPLSCFIVFLNAFGKGLVKHRGTYPALLQGGNPHQVLPLALKGILMLLPTVKKCYRPKLNKQKDRPITNFFLPKLFLWDSSQMSMWNKSNEFEKHFIWRVLFGTGSDALSSRC